MNHCRNNCNPMFCFLDSLFIGGKKSIHLTSSEGIKAPTPRNKNRCSDRPFAPPR
jgi:hypothetical protein